MSVTRHVHVGTGVFLLSWMHPKVGHLQGVPHTSHREHASSHFHYTLMSVYLCVCTCFSVHNVTCDLLLAGGEYMCYYCGRRFHECVLAVSSAVSVINNIAHWRDCKMYDNYPFSDILVGFNCLHGITALSCMWSCGLECCLHAFPCWFFHLISVCVLCCRPLRLSCAGGAAGPGGSSLRV